MLDGMTSKERTWLLAALRTSAVTFLAWAAGYLLTSGGWSPLFLSDYGAAIALKGPGGIHTYARDAGLGFAAVALAICLWREVRAPRQ